MYMSLQCEDSPWDTLITYTKETSISDEACLALKSQHFFCNKFARKQYSSQVAESNTKKSKHQNNNALHATGK